MKKIVCFLVGLTLLFTTAFAGSADALSDAMDKTTGVTSLSAQMTSSVKINEPLLILDTIPLDDDVPLDLKLFVNELAKATTKSDYSFSRSEDYKKMDLAISIESDTPVHLNEDLRIDSWSKSSLWLSYDVADKENPSFKIIAKAPFDMKYQVIDFSKFLKNNPKLIELFNKDDIDDIVKKLKDALLKNAQVSAVGNQYTLSIDDDGAKQYIIDIFDIYKEYIAKSPASRYGVVEEIDAFIEQVKKVINETSLLGENGLKINFSKNNEGIINAQVEELHIRFNVFDILDAYGSSTEGLTREQAFVDFTMKTELKTSNHNKTEVIFPEITDENSEYSNMEYVLGNVRVISDEPPLFKNNTVYYPIESIAENDMLSLETEIKDEVITIKYPGGKVLMAYENSVNLDGEDMDYITPAVVIENGKVYCLQEFLYPLNIDWLYTYYDTESKSFKFNYTYDVNQLIEEDEENYEPYVPQEYIPPTLYYNLDIDRAAYTNNGIAYIPVYELVNHLFPGEFAFGENSLTYTAIAENVFGIHSFKVSEGDMFVTINEDKRPLESAATIVDGVLNIPLSFVKELGINEGYMQVKYDLDGYGQTHYHLSMPNPKYDGEDNYPYVSKMLRVYVDSDRMPYTENNEVYVPAYDFLIKMYKGEFTYYDNGLEYVGTTENPYGIKKISMYVGDNFVMVDDKKIEFENKVVSVDGIIRVPISFMEKLGMETSYISVHQMGSSYSFSIKNPKYVEPEETIDINREPSIYDNWFYQL